MKITVIGSGYVGLVSAACLADVGNHVLCLDIDANKVGKLQQGEVPIHEPGLDNLLAKNIAAGRITFTTDSEQAAKWGKIQFIAVGTPPDEDGSADMQYVLTAARNIGKHIEEYTLIVDKSTVPVGTADQVKRAIASALQERAANIPFSVVSNPEFLKEGAAIDDFMRPERIVVGCDDIEAKEMMRTLYEPFQRNHQRLIFMDVKSAELTKYAANAMLATRISFMNELANLAEIVGADIESVRLGIGSDQRIGYDFLYPGCGYGGSCFPKDVKALIKTAKSVANIDLEVLAAVERVNERQKHLLAEKVLAYYAAPTTLINSKNNHVSLNSNILRGKNFAMWGLAFKPGTDDMREAPSRTIIADLLSAGATITAYDPVASEEASRIFAGDSRIKFCQTALAALDKADALLIVTEWKEFRSPDFALIKSALKEAVIFDGRNLYDPGKMKAHGFNYFAIGRKKSIANFH